MREPVFLDISSGICNAKCSWCWMPYLKKDFNLNRFMTLKNVQKIIEINKNQQLKITFSGWGEALINPEFFEILSLIAKNFKLGSIMTNFSKKLLKSQMRWMLFGFEKLVIEAGGLSPKTRHQNMHIENDAFFENIETLNDILLENFSLRNSVTVKIIRNKINNQEIISSNQDYVFNIIPCSLLIFDDEFYKHVTLDKNQSYFLDKNYQESVPIEISAKLKIGCTTKRILRITPSGNVLMCCTSPYGAYLGNAYETSLEDLISSDLYKENLKRMKLRTYCDNCKFCNE